jgi:hypothetical protein
MPTYMTLLHSGEDFLRCYDFCRSEVEEMAVVRRTVVKCCELNDTLQ